MTLTFTQEELKEGVSMRRIGEKRLAKIRSEMTSTGAFSVRKSALDGAVCSGVVIDGAVCSGVVIHTIEPTGQTGFMKMLFSPVCYPVFEVYEKRGELRALVLDAKNQVTIDAEEVRPSSVTLRGPGADPEMVEKASLAFGKLVSTNASNPIVRAMIQHVRRLCAK